MPWTTLPFGKYMGKTLPQVLFTDPDWFFWAMEEKAFKSAGLKREAALLDRRARRIRIPQETGEDLVVEYFIHPQAMEFSGMQLVPRTRPLHQGSSPTRRGDVIDMSMPRRIAPYDKLGGKLLVSDLKHLLFGSKRHVMTRQRAEAFFDEARNFKSG